MNLILNLEFNWAFAHFTVLNWKFWSASFCAMCITTKIKHILFYHLLVVAHKLKNICSLNHRCLFEFYNNILTHNFPCFLNLISTKLTFFWNNLFQSLIFQIGPIFITVGKLCTFWLENIVILWGLRRSTCSQTCWESFNLTEILYFVAWICIFDSIFKHFDVSFIWWVQNGRVYF